MPKKKWQKVLIIILLTVFSLVAGVIIFVSPISKYLVEKYDVTYTGREIKMGWAYVNPFTGYIHFNKFIVYENSSDSAFFSADGISANISILKLFSKNYEISTLVLNRPKGKVIKNKLLFNFSDLIQKFSKDEKQIVVKTKPVKFSVLDVVIKEGEFYFNEPLTPISYFIKNVNLKSKGKFLDIDTINGTLSFETGIGEGEVQSDFMINTNSLDYRIDVIAHKLDLNLIQQYLKDLSNYGTVSALIDANLKAKGNFNDQERINIKGDLAINEFHLGKKQGDDYASFKLLKVGITELDPEHKKYFFDSVLLSQPYIKYERYDYLDNFQRMFGDKGSAVAAVNGNPEKFNLILEVAKYVKVVFKNFLQSAYIVNHLAVKEGDVKYNDFTLNEKFSASLYPLNLTSDSINNTKRNVHLSLQSGIKPYGSMEVALSMSTTSNEDFDLNYKFQNIPATQFNPYLNSYTSYSLNRGHIEMFGKWKVRKDIIQSTNHFLAIDPRLTNKSRKKNTRWLPLPLIMFLVRESGNVIDYEIPITGDLKNPKFHIRDAIIDLIENIFIKPAKTEYRYEVRSTEEIIENFLTLTWKKHQTKLLRSQEKFINEIADYLKENPASHIVVTPINYADKEKEYILFYEAKKKYFMAQKGQSKKNWSEVDSITIDKMSVKNPSFEAYLNQHTKDKSLFTTQEKCYHILGKAFIDEKYNQLVGERERVFMAFFKENKTNNQLKLNAGNSDIPFNGFSYFKISYKGDMPKELIKAAEKMEEFNANSPRKKYSEIRKKAN